MQDEIAIQLDVGETMSCAGSLNITCTLRVNISLFCVVDLIVYGADQ